MQTVALNTFWCAVCILLFIQYWFMKLLPLFFILFSAQSLLAQNVQLAIIDSLNHPIYGATVYKNSTKIGTFYSEIVSFNAKAKDTLRVKANFYEDYEVVLKEEDFYEDTLRMKIMLIPKARLLDEVIINAEETSSYYNVENSNVIDYFPYGDLCFYALKEKGERYVQLNSCNKVINKAKINFIATKFFLDVFGNFHLLSADSAYQMWSNEAELNWLDPVSIAVFNEQVQPLVGKTDSSVFTQKYEYANKFYKIKLIQNDTVKFCYSTFDKIGYRVAQTQENKIIGMYYASVPSHENIIELGLWDGNFVQLQTFHNRKITAEIGWYKAALDNPIKCQAFGMEKCIAVVDFFRDSVALLDYKTGELLQNSKLQTPTTKACFTFYDYFYDVIYFLENTGNGLDIYELNPADGTTKKLKGIYGIPFVENIKISGDWVYFEVRERTGFNQIYRQRIR